MDQPCEAFAEAPGLGKVMQRTVFKAGPGFHKEVRF